MELTTADDLTPRERVVFLAACFQQDADDGTGKTQVIFDRESANECERLTELGLLERVEVDRPDGQRELAGYRLSAEAAHAHLVRSEIEAAQGSVN